MINLKYGVIIYWSTVDNCFLAEMPELSGCIADGKTYEDAVGNLKTIAIEWIETAQSINREIPKPKGKLLFA